MRPEPKDAPAAWSPTDCIVFMLTHYDVWSATPMPQPAAGESRP